MFSNKNYKALLKAETSGHPLISIYIGTERAGSNEKFVIKFKNALTEALNQLTDSSSLGKSAMTERDAKSYLSDGYDLLEDSTFWSYLSDGLAVFIGRDIFEFYTVPISFNDFSYVGDQFYLRHMLPLITDDHRFFVLALSQNEVRFFEGTKNSITPVKISDLVPGNIDEMIGADDKDKVLQHHDGGGQQGVYHGHGGAKDKSEKEIYKYFRDIDKGLMEMLHDETVPLVLYSVEEQIAMYKEVSNYANIADAKVTGNPESDDAVTIHEQAWSVLRNSFTEKRKALREQFEQALASNKASFSVHHVAPAAFNGKVETLFVDQDTPVVWGTYDRATDTLDIQKERTVDSICVLNEAALATYNNGGTVYNIPRIEFPRIVAQVNAIYRY